MFLASDPGQGWGVCMEMLALAPLWKLNRRDSENPRGTSRGRSSEKRKGFPYYSHKRCLDSLVLGPFSFFDWHRIYIRSFWNIIQQNQCIKRTKCVYRTYLKEPGASPFHSWFEIVGFWMRKQISTPAEIREWRKLRAIASHWKKRSW